MVGVLEGPAILRMAIFYSLWKGNSWTFCWFHQTSAPKSATVVIQLWYNCLTADWLRPRSVFPRRDRAMKTLMAEVVLVRRWYFHVSFLSSQNPNHLCTLDGSISVPLGRTTLTYGSMISFLAL